MILPFIVEKSSYDDILENADIYINNFLFNGVLIFKSLPIAEEEQRSIIEAFARKLDWGHISSQDSEDHSFTINRLGSNKCSDREILVPWHLEHCHKNDRQLASSWHMTKFECPKTSGATGFLNSDDVFNQMSDKWIDLLRSSIVCHAPNGITINALHRKAVTTHRNTGKEILNLPPALSRDVLISVNNEPPTNEHIHEFKLIIKFIENTVEAYNNRQKHWHEWSQNDLVIIDLSTIYHAVKGGFEIGQRKFNRYWAYSSEESLARSGKYSDS